MTRSTATGWYVILDADGYNTWTRSRLQYSRWLNEARTIRRTKRRLNRAARRGHLYYEMRTDRIIRKARQPR